MSDDMIVSANKLIATQAKALKGGKATSVEFSSFGLDKTLYLSTKEHWQQLNCESLLTYNLLHVFFDLYWYGKEFVSQAMTCQFAFLKISSRSDTFGRASRLGQS